MACITDPRLTAPFKVQWCKYRLRTPPQRHDEVRSIRERDHVGSGNGGFMEQL